MNAIQNERRHLVKKQESSPLPLPLIRAYPKEGIALHAEETVQALLDHPNDTDDIIQRSDKIIGDHFNPSTNGEYKKAAWRTKIGMAAVGHLVLRGSMLNILDNNHHFGVLHRPDLRFDTFDSGCSHTNAIRDASSGAYWLRVGTKQLSQQVTAYNHPYRQLYKYYTAATEQHHIWLREWRAGPGKNRWPAVDHETFNCSERLSNSFQFNYELAVSLMCAKAIHHLIHKNSRAEANELYGAVMQSIEPISWQTTGSRHYGWVPNWRELFENNERPPGMAPIDGLLALLSIPPNLLTTPNRLAASADGSSIMKDPDFCLHQALRNGPVPRAGLCAADIFVRQTNRDDRDIARAFFGVLDMDPANGDCYSLGGVVFAMGGVVLKNTILPAYEARKRDGDW